MGKYNIIERKNKKAAYCSLMNPVLMDDLQEKITRIIVSDKKYKDKAYSAKKLASDLATNTRYISAVINVRFHTNYTSFVNKYRIADAMEMLTDRHCIGMSMEDISDTVGFANRQSFYASFFKINGCTPRSYKVHYFSVHPVKEPKMKLKSKK